MTDDGVSFQFHFDPGMDLFQKIFNDTLKEYVEMGLIEPIEIKKPKVPERGKYVYSSSHAPIGSSTTHTMHIDHLGVTTYYPKKWEYYG